MLCLTQSTDPRWADIAVANVGAVLADHAHCEMKAASNALSLASRLPSFPRVARVLVELAEEELRHFRAVLDELERRNLVLGKPEVDEYAAELRRIAAEKRSRSAGDAIADRLLIGALIEARSCERFSLLIPVLSKVGEQELASFYEDLFASEARHYRTFFDLAMVVQGDEAMVRERLEQLAHAEGRLIKRFGTRPAIHG